MAANIIVGPVAPESLRVTISRGSQSVDLSTVTSALLQIIRQGSGARQTWGTSIISQAADTIVLEHVFQAGEANKTGAYTVLAFLTVPSGTVRARCEDLNVVEP